MKDNFHASGVYITLISLCHSDLKDMKEDKMNELEHKVLAAAHEYWEEHVHQNGEQDNALVWVRNDVTGEMLCLTKGGYTNRLSNFIGKLN
jgi:hypothetical protein